jgi:transaldolase/glucose-6-phosphate isomerase
VSDAALTVEAHIPASLAEAVEQKLARAAQIGVAERLRAQDPTLWGPEGAPEIGDRLGWLTIAERMLERVDELTAFAGRVREDGLHDVVLLGMGGSSLAPEVLRRCFGSADGHPRLHVLDSTDAATIGAVTRAIDPQRTLFLVSSKSGGTIEPLSLFAHFWSLAARGENFAAITDPGSGLEELARAHGFREVFAGDPNIGGRYSALSPFGIVPAALIGVDVRALLTRAAQAWQTATTVQLTQDAALQATASVWLGAALSALAGAGRDKLTFLISPSLPGLGLWLEQLVAESTGKRETGILPVADEPPGAAGDYGADRVFAHLPDSAAPDQQLDELARALARAGHPVLTVPTAGPFDLGRVFLLWELAVAVAGWGLQINPFDQPNVQQAKDATKRVLEEYERTGRLPEPPDADGATVPALVGEASPPQYVALMGYTRPSPELDDAIAALRAAIRARGGATTTFGYGPRFLHSTGQYHKGGPRTGRFLQLVHDSGEDIEIPGAGYTFDTLKHAQASGDLQTLRELGLPAERVRLRGEDVPGAVRDLAATISGSRRET